MLLLCDVMKNFKISKRKLKSNALNNIRV